MPSKMPSYKLWLTDMGIRKPKTTLNQAKRRAGIPGAKSRQSSEKKEPSRMRPRTSSVRKERKAETMKSAAFPAQPPSPAKIQVFLSAYLPHEGVSSTFDTLCQQYSPNKALQMILRRAMDHYEEYLVDGSFSSKPSTYETAVGENSGFKIQTSRNMPHDVLETAIAHFNPLGLESRRAFGLKLATAALAAFFFANAQTTPE